MQGKSIVIFVNNLGLGGAERQIVNIIQGLSHKYKFHVITIIPSTYYIEDILATGTPITTIFDRRFSFINFLRNTLNILNILNDTSIIVSFNYHANIIGRLYKIFKQNKYLITSIRSENFGSKKRSGLIAKTEFLTDMNLFNSEIVMNKLRSEKIVGNDSVVIFNGIDIEKYSMQRDFEIKGSFIWLMVGNHKASKGYNSQLYAAKILKERGLDFTIMCIGGGPLIDEHNRLRIELGLEDKVIFLGYKDDIIPYLFNANGFVMPSAWEGFPNVLLEASLAQLPIVATEVGGVIEIVPKDLGEIIGNNSPVLIADAMIRTMEASVETTKSRSIELQRRNSSLFSVRTINSKWMELFNDPELFLSQNRKYLK